MNWKILLIMVVLMAGAVYADSYYTTDDTGSYQWDYGVFEQTMSDGENVSLGKSLDNYTKLLLNLNGPDDSTTDADFVDSSLQEHSVTQEGNAKLENTQKKFGATSGYFDGSGDSLTIPNSEDWDFGNEDFTIDFWVRFDSLSVVDFVRMNNFVFFYYQPQHCLCGYINGGEYALSTNSNFFPEEDIWYHIALVSNGGKWYLFQNGILIDSDLSVSPLNNNLEMKIGGGWTSRELNGYIDGFRISKGIARWTSNFNVPSGEYPYYSLGNYTSQIFDAGYLVSWDNLSWGENPPTVISEGDYIDSFDTSAHGSGNMDITTDGTNIWIIDQGDKEVYKYDMSGNYISSFDTSAQGTLHVGITTDGTNIWILNTIDFGVTNVYKYDMSGNYVSYFGFSGHGSQNYGITTDGTNIWIIDSTDEEVFKYDMSGNYINSWDTSAHSYQDYSYGVSTDGTNIWVVETLFT